MHACARCLLMLWTCEYRHSNFPFTTWKRNRVFDTNESARPHIKRQPNNSQQACIYELKTFLVAIVMTMKNVFASKMRVLFCVCVWLEFTNYNLMNGAVIDLRTYFM